jgi:hypothetical protein
MNSQCQKLFSRKRRTQVGSLIFVKLITVSWQAYGVTIALYDKTIKTNSHMG